MAQFTIVIDNLPEDFIKEGFRLMHQVVVESFGLNMEIPKDDKVVIDYNECGTFVLSSLMSDVSTYLHLQAEKKAKISN